MSRAAAVANLVPDSRRPWVGELGDSQSTDEIGPVPEREEAFEAGWR
jgi:hypothetical protein